MGRSAEFEVGGSPVARLQAGAVTYGRGTDFFDPHMHEAADRAVMNVQQSRRLGTAHEQMSTWDESARPAYRAMGEEAGRQFDHLTKPVSKGGVGLNVEVTKDDPYGGGGARPNDIMREMRSDVENNNRLRILSTHTTGGHPFFSDDENDRIRAVHDAFGHLGSGRGIDMHGEEAAYQRHASMFSPVARQATATEFRGQTAYLLKNNAFPPQRMGLLPEHMQSPQFASVNLKSGDYADARTENRKQGL